MVPPNGRFIQWGKTNGFLLFFMDPILRHPQKKALKNSLSHGSWKKSYGVPLISIIVPSCSFKKATCGAPLCAPCKYAWAVERVLDLCLPSQHSHWAERCRKGSHGFGTSNSEVKKINDFSWQLGGFHQHAFFRHLFAIEDPSSSPPSERNGTLSWGSRPKIKPKSIWKSLPSLVTWCAMPQWNYVELLWRKKKTVMKETLMRTCENVQSQKCMLNHFMNHWVIWSWIFLGISPYTFLVALATISTGRFAPSSCPNVDRQCPGCRWWPRAQLATCSVRMSHEDITSQSMCANHQLRRTLLLKIED